MLGIEAEVDVEMGIRTMKVDLGSLLDRVK